MDVRSRLVEAAFARFTTEGFEATTVDQIADAAGVSRRTFFRYFDTKEDVVFPDHEGLRAAVRSDLERRRNQPALAAVCASIHIVLDDYLRNRDAAVLRFALTRTVPALRAREINSVYRYQRLFARYLREHIPDSDPLMVDVMAASVVTTHNSILRDWLVDGAGSDPSADLTAGLARVQALFAGRAAGTARGSAIAVFALDSDMGDVVEAIAGAIGPDAARPASGRRKSSGRNDRKR
jgi:AcrR family transcriptional regulator